MSRPWLIGSLLLLSVGVAGCQSAASLPPLPQWQSPEGRAHAQLGEIRDLRRGKTISAAELVAQLAAADRVLVGEQHDNPDHHALQLWLLKALAAQRAQGSLLLEMLEPAQQARIEQVRGLSPLPVELDKAIDWQSGWDWKLYGPIVREAMSHSYPLLAANLDRSEIREIYRARPALSGSHSTAESVRQALLEQVREGHCGLLPESQMPAMLAVQQQRDRRMAERLLSAPTPTLLFAGGYHARKDIGVPLHLADLGSESATRVLLLAQVGEEVQAGMADYVWYTAALAEQDYCASLRKGN